MITAAIAIGAFMTGIVVGMPVGFQLGIRAAKQSYDRVVDKWKHGRGSEPNLFS